MCYFDSWSWISNLTHIGKALPDAFISFVWGGEKHRERGCGGGAVQAWGLRGRGWEQRQQGQWASRTTLCRWSWAPSPGMWRSWSAPWGGNPPLRCSGEKLVSWTWSWPLLTMCAGRWWQMLAEKDINNSELQSNILCGWLCRGGSARTGDTALGVTSR